MENFRGDNLFESSSNEHSRRDIEDISDAES